MCDSGRARDEAASRLILSLLFLTLDLKLFHFTVNKDAKYIYNVTKNAILHI